ncbi:MAG: hypothetical protein ACOC56_04535 [Atribacterota bacterium]
MKIKQENKIAQDIQDGIFKKMSADRKIELGSQFWQLARDLTGGRNYHGKNRSKVSFSKNCKNS